MSSDTESEFLIVPYEPRRVRYLGAIDTGGWRVKAYAIAARERRYDAGAVGTAMARATRILPPARPLGPGETNYGMAFLVAHFDLDASRFLVGWWVDDGLLRQRLFTAPVDRPGALEEATTASWGLNVFDLAVIDGERRFFVQHMMARSGPDPVAYIKAAVTGEV
jgi:hypothetical protein